MKIRFILVILILPIFSGCEKIEQVKNKNKVYLIQPFENIPEKYLLEVKNTLETHFERKVCILPAISLPEQAYYKPRNRYRADSLIRYLKRIAPDSCYKIIGLTNRDISTTKGEYADWGIFGLGFRPGKSCVVSFFRLRKNVDEEKLISRVRKVSLHEIGHTLDLPHCKTKGCVMQDAKGKAATVDGSQEAFCDKCRSQVR